MKLPKLFQKHPPKNPKAPLTGGGIGDIAKTGLGFLTSSPIGMGIIAILAVAAIIGGVLIVAFVIIGGNADQMPKLPSNSVVADVVKKNAVLTLAGQQSNSTTIRQAINKHVTDAAQITKIEGSLTDLFKTRYPGLTDQELKDLFDKYSLDYLKFPERFPTANPITTTDIDNALKAAGVNGDTREALAYDLLLPLKFNLSRIEMSNDDLASIQNNEIDSRIIRILLYEISRHAYLKVSFKDKTLYGDNAYRGTDENSQLTPPEENPDYYQNQNQTIAVNQYTSPHYHGMAMDIWAADYINEQCVPTGKKIPIDLSWQVRDQNQDALLSTRQSALQDFLNKTNLPTGFLNGVFNPMGSNKLKQTMGQATLGQVLGFSGNVNVDSNLSMSATLGRSGLEADLGLPNGSLHYDSKAGVANNMGKVTLEQIFGVSGDSFLQIVKTMGLKALELELGYPADTLTPLANLKEEDFKNLGELWNSTFWPTIRKIGQGYVEDAISFPRHSFDGDTTEEVGYSIFFRQVEKYLDLPNNSLTTGNAAYNLSDTAALKIDGYMLMLPSSKLSKILEAAYAGYKDDLYKKAITTGVTQSPVAYEDWLKTNPSPKNSYDAQLRYCREKLDPNWGKWGWKDGTAKKMRDKIISIINDPNATAEQKRTMSILISLLVITNYQATTSAYEVDKALHVRAGTTAVAVADLTIATEQLILNDTTPANYKEFSKRAFLVLAGRIAAAKMYAAIVEAGSNPIPKSEKELKEIYDKQKADFDAQQKEAADGKAVDLTMTYGGTVEKPVKKDFPSFADWRKQGSMYTKEELDAAAKRGETIVNYLSEDDLYLFLTADLEAGKIGSEEGNKIRANLAKNKGLQVLADICSFDFKVKTKVKVRDTNGKPKTTEIQAKDMFTNKPKVDKNGKPVMVKVFVTETKEETINVRITPNDLITMWDGGRFATVAERNNARLMVCARIAIRPFEARIGLPRGTIDLFLSKGEDISPDIRQEVIDELWGKYKIPPDVTLYLLYWIQGGDWIGAGIMLGLDKMEDLLLKYAGSSSFTIKGKIVDEKKLQQQYKELVLLLNYGFKYEKDSLKELYPQYYDSATDTLNVPTYEQWRQDQGVITKPLQKGFLTKYSSVIIKIVQNKGQITPQVQDMFWSKILGDLSNYALQPAIAEAVYRYVLPKITFSDANAGFMYNVYLKSLQTISKTTGKADLGKAVSKEEFKTKMNIKVYSEAEKRLSAERIAFYIADVNSPGILFNGFFEPERSNEKLRQKAYLKNSIYIGAEILAVTSGWDRAFIDCFVATALAETGERIDALKECAKSLACSFGESTLNEWGGKAVINGSTSPEQRYETYKDNLYKQAQTSGQTQTPLSYDDWYTDSGQREGENLLFEDNDINFADAGTAIRAWVCNKIPIENVLMDYGIKKLGEKFGIQNGALIGQALRGEVPWYDPVIAEATAQTIKRGAKPLAAALAKGLTQQMQTDAVSAVQKEFTGKTLEEIKAIVAKGGDSEKLLATASKTQTAKDISAAMTQKAREETAAQLQKQAADIGTGPVKDTTLQATAPVAEKATETVASKSLAWLAGPITDSIIWAGSTVWDLAHGGDVKDVNWVDLGKIAGCTAFAYTATTVAGVAFTGITLGAGAATLTLIPAGAAGLYTLCSLTVDLALFLADLLGDWLDKIVQSGITQCYKDAAICKIKIITSELVEMGQYLKDEDGTAVFGRQIISTFDMDSNKSRPIGSWAMDGLWDRIHVSVGRVEDDGAPLNFSVEKPPANCCPYYINVHDKKACNEASQTQLTPQPTTVN